MSTNFEWKIKYNCNVSDIRHCAFLLHKLFLITKREMQIEIMWTSTEKVAIR